MSVTTESLREQLDRLNHERNEANGRYAEALARLDRSITPQAGQTQPFPSSDVTRLDEINQGWAVLSGGRPPVDRSLASRLRRFVWKLLCPPVVAQQQFNAALVDHLNRTAVALSHFQSYLIRYLQTVAPYVDTGDRGVASGPNVLNAAISAVNSDSMKRFESLSVRCARTHDGLHSQMDDVLASVEDLRATASLAQQTSLSLKREVERLLTRPAEPVPDGAAAGNALAPPAVNLDDFKYLGFENEFRGSLDEIRRRLEAYLPLFEGRTDVLDIGCGRGEFLDLLQSRGISARGVDINDAMVEDARSRGLSVEKGDALASLSALPDASLGGVFAAQVIEHLPADYLATLIEVAAQKIRPGGIIVLETINPACWVAFFESYIRDLTHVRPLHPETMQYLLRVSGFSHVRVQYSSPVPEESRLKTVPAVTPDDPPAVANLIDAFNSNINLLNGRLFSAQDYAVIGERE